MTVSESHVYALPRSLIRLAVPSLYRDICGIQPPHLAHSADLSPVGEDF